MHVTAPPKLETVLTVISGRASSEERRFKWGEVVPQFCVGSRGDWIVFASDVASIHLLLTFDGRRLHAASVQREFPVYLEDWPIPPRWTAVPVFSRLRFGRAILTVTCAEAAADDRAYWAPPAQIDPSEQRAAAKPRLGGTQPLSDYREELARRRSSTPHPPARGSFQAETAPVRVLGRQTPR